MPFRSLDDLRYLIEDELPRQAKDLLVKANAWLEEHARRNKYDRRDMRNEVYVAMIIRAMTDMQCWSDPDDDGSTTKVWLPRFSLRH